VNPFTGKYTHLTMDNAALIIQRLVRLVALKSIMLTKESIQKVVKLYQNTKSLYLEDMSRLSNVINYAIFSFAIDHDEVQTKKLLLDSLQLAENNALVTRTYAVYLICTCEAPRQVTRERAESMLKEAFRRDVAGARFQTSHDIFQFACLREPRNVQALLNLAVIECLVFQNMAKSEKLFRRALAIDPFNERVVELWFFLKDRFGEIKNLFKPKSYMDAISYKKGGKKKMIHGRPVYEDPIWAGWVFVEEDIYFMSKKIFDTSYWYNPADHSEQEEMPNFKEEWKLRKKRSKFIELSNNLELYYDELTSSHFQYHPLTMTFM
jgi:hypothetical protein